MSKKSNKPREVNFASAIQTLSQMVDQKFLATMQNYTQALSSAQVRIEVLEDLLMEKMGETEESMKERVLLRIAKMQGFQESNGDVLENSILRVRVKEEVVGQESPSTQWQDAFMVVGKGQVNADLDKALVGAKLGETRELVLPDPNNASVQRKLTATVVKIYKGQEVAPASDDAPIAEAAQG